jgi:hypothetical protein
LFLIQFLIIVYYYNMSTIATDTILTQDIINKYTWPVTIDAGVKVTLGDTLSISTDQGTNGYFKIGGDNVQILGNNKTVTITNIPNYPGLFQNGTNTESGSPLIIQDLGILSTGTTTLAVDGGWLGQSYFGKDLSADSINVTDCYSTGDITGGSSGGIFGVFSSGTATNCYSTGGIFGGGAGGIFGDGAGGTATNCYSTGGIFGGGAGGIFGDGGGIFGDGAGGTATNCYSTGDISGVYTGGIFGAGSSGNATNCYSTGDITGEESGGIFGAGSYGNATNCYSTGNITSVHAGGIFGDGAGGTATNCYIANGSWSDSVASTSLTDIDNVWLDYDSNLTNIPWLLKSFNTVVTPPPPFLRIVSIKVIGTYKSLI